MTMITPSYLGETIEYSSLHACRSTLEDPMVSLAQILGHESLNTTSRYSQRNAEQLAAAAERLQF